MIYMDYKKKNLKNFMVNYVKRFLRIFFGFFFYNGDDFASIIAC